MKIKKEIAKISAVIILAFLSQLILYSSVPKLDTGSRPFNRAFSTSTLQLIKTVEKPNIIDHFVGYIDGVFCFSTAIPGVILKYDSSLNLIATDTIMAIYNNRYDGISEMSIDSAGIHYTSHDYKTLYTIDYNTKEVKSTFKTPFSFSRVVQVSPTSYVFRYFDSTGSKDQLFIKLMNKGVIESFPEKNISERKGDAGISTDGILHYNSSSNLIIYSHFYTGLIYGIDTNLNLVLRSNTLDSIVENKTIAATTSNSTVTNVSPRYYNSYYSAIGDNNKLYISSAIRSDNENDEDFKNNSTIDVYNGATLKYEYSFLLPGFKNKKALTFKVVQGRLIALYPSSIAIYHLNHQ